ncbi:MAG: hypothetical protein U0793_26185 [Gemmataceae bacterium]
MMHGDAFLEEIRVFRVEEKRHGVVYQVFTVEDPRRAGYKGNVEEGVTLDYDLNAVHSWPDGACMPEACLGRAPDNPKHYKVFKYAREREAAAYEAIPGTTAPFGSWKDYARLHLIPPDPDQTDEEQWFEYQDKVDEDARRRRQRKEPPEPPLDGDRDEVAAWVARKHLFMDVGVREVWYLPKGAPPEEIRLLELSDRAPLAPAMTEPIDFGLEVQGATFRLVVADVSSEQFEEIRRDPSRLPSGWSLSDSRTWRRGA